MTIFENDKLTLREPLADELERLMADSDFSCRLSPDAEIFAAAAADGTLLGAVALQNYTDWNMHGLVFFTLPEHRRCGYAAQCVRAVTRWFYDNRGENMLIAVVDLENVPAVRTLERAGYVYIRSTTLRSENDTAAVYHLFNCPRSVADAGAPARGCCCGCGGHAE